MWWIAEFSGRRKHKKTHLSHPLIDRHYSYTRYLTISVFNSQLTFIKYCKHRVLFKLNPSLFFRPMSLPVSCCTSKSSAKVVHTPKLCQVAKWIASRIKTLKLREQRTERMQWLLSFSLFWVFWLWSEQQGIVRCLCKRNSVHSYHKYV